MAWIVSERRRRSIVFVDDSNPQKRAIDASISPLHYQSVLDSGDYDAPINLSPVRIQNAQLDGWRVVANDWHYALGQPGNKATDGWIGFGGRQGQHWLMARLFRLGYIRWSDKLWTDVGGAPDYNRSNLSQETHIWTCPTNGEQFTLSTAATWANIWQAPGGGVVDAAWKAHPLGLKEHIYINQAGRDYIASQWPGGSTTARYFSLAFQVDALNIPRWKLGSILQQSIDDVDNESAAVITGETAAGQLLFSLPLDWAWVEDANGEEIAGSRIPLRKRLYLENGQYILLVGARVDQLNALPSGTLVLDPTIDTQVGAGADDGRVYQDTADYSNADTNTYVGWSHPSNGVSDAWARFTGISGLGGSTIDVAYYSVEGVAKQGTPLTKIYAEDAAAPTAPTSLSDYNGRSRTAAAVDWDNPGTWTNSGFNDSPSIVSVIQELADSYDPSAIQILHEDDGSATGSNNRLVYSSYDAGSTLAPKLHIEYTAAGGGGTFEDALTLARTAAQTAVNTMDMQPSLSFSRQMAASLAGLLDIEAALSLARSGGISFAGGLATENALTLARASDLAFVANVTLDQAISLSRSSGVDLSTTLTLEETVALARVAGMNLAGVLVIEESLSLARDAGMTVSGGLVLASDLSLARAAGLTLGSDLSKEVALSLSRSVAMGQATQLDAVADLTLARVADLSADSLADFGAAVSLARANGLGLAGVLTLEEALTLARSATAVFVSDLVSGGEVVGSVVELSDSALYIVSLTDSALYIVNLSDDER